MLEPQVKPDRVVVVSDDSTASGGASSVALASIRLMKARGIEVTLLSGHGTANPEIERVGVEVVSFGGLNLLEGNPAAVAFRGIYDHAIRTGVASWIAENDTPKTVYHLHNWHKVLSPSVFGALKPVSARLLMSAHDYFLVCPNGAYFDFQKGEVCDLRPLSGACVRTNCDRRNYGHKLWRMTRQMARGHFMRLADTPALVIAPHEGMIEPLRRGGFQASSIRVLRNPVSPWTTKRVAAEKNKDVVFVGRLEQDKGIDLIAKAASAAGVKLTIVGEGALREEIARDCPEHAIVGWKSRSELTEIASAARLVVVPTRWRETFGLVTFEAATSGIPVLISRFALVADELGGLGCAEIFDPQDISETAKSLLRLFQDDHSIKRMSCSGFEHATSLAPDPETWCDELLGLYSEVLGRHHLAVLPHGSETVQHNSIAG